MKVVGRLNSPEAFLLFVTFQEKGKQILKNMRDLEKEKLAEMETYLVKGVDIDHMPLVVNLFSNTAQEEMDAYSLK